MDEASEGEVAGAAVEAYIYLYPLVLMDATREAAAALAGRFPGFGPPNAVTHLRRLPSARFKGVVRVNFDTLYSSGWLDLSGGPVLVSVPETRGRYYVIPFLDAWSDVFAVVGTRTTGSAAGTFALCGPGYAGRPPLPAGAVRIDAPTPAVWMISRVQTNGEGDYAAVHTVQDGMRVEPLGVRKPVTPPADVPLVPPKVRVAGMPGDEFFARAARALAANPPHAVDQPVLARMARLLGVRAGVPLYRAPSERVRAALEAAPAAAGRLIDGHSPHPVVNGWQVWRENVGAYGANRLTRAHTARNALAANLPEDTVYAVALADSLGRSPRGDSQLALRFPPGGEPPADAFWSVTVYDAQGFPHPNRLRRCSLGSCSDGLRRDADGAVRVHVGSRPPPGGGTDNWIPAPEGEIGLTLRIYQPRRVVLDGRWSPPPLVTVGDSSCAPSKL